MPELTNIKIIDHYIYKGCKYPRVLKSSEDEEIFMSLVLEPTGDYFLIKFDSGGEIDIIEPVAFKSVGIGYRKENVNYDS